MNCPNCANIEDIKDLSRPYVLRECKGCGRELKLRTPGKHGIGLQVEKGDRPVLPAAFLTISANPLKGGGNLSRYGIGWFAELVFGLDLAKQERRADMVGTVRAMQEESEKFFTSAPYLAGLDLDDPANSEEMYKRMSQHQKSTEWWGFMSAGFCYMAGEAIERGDAAEAAWALACAERFRSLAIFKANFEEVVYMGHSAKRLITLLQIWDSNRENSDEGFWQKILSEHAYAISQLFAVPVTLIQGNAYVGGMKIDRNDARWLDFLLTGGHSDNAILLEIKTPVAKLLGAKYRKNVHAPSAELSGSIVQISDYRHSFTDNIIALKQERNLELNAFNPKCVVLIGNHKRELDTPRKKASFELFRNSLSGMEVVTFDEFFRKVEQLARIFNLIRTEKNPSASPEPGPPG